MARRPRLIWGLLAVAAAVALDVWATWLYAGLVGATNDFFPRWLGTHLWLTQGLDPYSPAVDQAIRAAMGLIPGALSRPGTGGASGASGVGAPTGPFVFGFVYPAYVAVLLAPLGWLPFRWAALAWLLLAQWCLGAGAWCCWRAAERDFRLPSAPAWPALVVALLFPAAVLNFVLLQFVAPVFLALAASWWLAGRQRWVWAGLALLPALIKPQLALVPTACLLLSWWQQRRSGGQRALASWGAGAAMWLLVSLVLFPSWPARFLASTQAYAAGAQAVSAAGLVASWVRVPWVLMAMVVVVGVVGPLPRPLPIARRGDSGGTGEGFQRSLSHYGLWLRVGVLLGVWLVPPVYQWNALVLLVVVLTWLRLMWAEETAWRAAALGVLLVGAVATVPALVAWPSASRVLWPAVVLVAHAMVARRVRTLEQVDRTVPVSEACQDGVPNDVIGITGSG